MPLRRRTLKKYPNNYFIETGSFKGGGISKALNTGFKEVHSIEINKIYYNHCRNRFKNNNNVHLYFGNSVSFLPGVLSNVHSPATIWLDAHVCKSSHPMPSHPMPSHPMPLLEELEIISSSPYIHTILIDDVRMWSKWSKKFSCDISEDVIKDIMLSIDKNYKFRYEDGHVENDIFVCYMDNLQA
jgi:hypothetical protein